MEVTENNEKTYELDLEEFTWEDEDRVKQDTSLAGEENDWHGRINYII